MTLIKLQSRWRMTDGLAKFILDAALTTVSCADKILFICHLLDLNL